MLSRYAEHENFDKLKIDLKKSNINDLDYMGQTPLYWACTRQNYKMARYLIKNGANPNIPNKYGIAPLHVASYYGNLKLVKLLIRNGAIVDCLTKYNATPLNIACTEERSDVITYLLKKNANTFIEDDNGVCAFH